MNRENLDALIETANKAYEAAKAIQAESQVDGKWVSDEAKANWSKAVDDAMELKDQADAGLKEYEAARKLDDFNAWATKSRGVLPNMTASRSDDGIVRVQYKSHEGGVKSFTPTGNKHFTASQEAEYTDIFRKYLVEGRGGLSSAELDIVDRKTLAMGSDTEGGALVASEVVSAELVQQIENSVLMRRLGRVLPPLTSATSLKVGYANHLDEGTWTTELATGSAETATPFGARSLFPHPLAKLVRISNTLMRLSYVDVESWVTTEGANRLGTAEETAFMTGSGVGQPEGVFTSSLPSTVTCASSTDIAYQDLVNTEFTLKAQYRPGASWIMHRTIIKEIMSLVDGVGRPLLREMPGAGIQYSLFNYPINETEYAPSSSATTLKVAALGNWKAAYWIVDTLNIQIQRLVELYAATNETGFIFRKETDGMLVNGNGAVLLVMA